MCISYEACCIARCLICTTATYTRSGTKVITGGVTERSRWMVQHHLRPRTQRTMTRPWTRQLSNLYRCIWKRSDAWSGVLDPNPPPCDDIGSGVVVHLCALYGHVCPESDTGLSLLFYGTCGATCGHSRAACASKVMSKVSWPGPCYRVPILYISIGSMHDRHVIGNGAAVLELRGSDKDRGSTRHLRHK